MAGYRFRQPGSRCIAFTSWTATAKTVQSGKRQIMPGSKGVVRVIFRRKYPVYDYTLNTPLRFDFWTSFVRAASVGKFWNAKNEGAVLMTNTTLTIERAEDRFILDWNGGEYRVEMSPEAFDAFSRALESGSALPVGGMTVYAFDVDEEEAFGNG